MIEVELAVQEQQRPVGLRAAWNDGDVESILGVSAVGGRLKEAACRGIGQPVGAELHLIEREGRASETEQSHQGSEHRQSHFGSPVLMAYCEAKAARSKVAGAEVASFPSFTTSYRCLKNIIGGEAENKRGVVAWQISCSLVTRQVFERVFRGVRFFVEHPSFVGLKRPSYSWAEGLRRPLLKLRLVLKSDLRLKAKVDRRPKHPVRLRPRRIAALRWKRGSLVGGGRSFPFSEKPGAS